MKEQLDRITDAVIEAAITVHRELGPGLLESTDEACLAYEPPERGLVVERQKELPVRYRGVQWGCWYRIDMLVEDLVALALKAVERPEPIHAAQLLSYLKPSWCKLGQPINFNVKVLKNGTRRLVNGLRD